LIRIEYHRLRDGICKAESGDGECPALIDNSPELRRPFDPGALAGLALRCCWSY